MQARITELTNQAAQQQQQQAEATANAAATQAMQQQQAQQLQLQQMEVLRATASTQAHAEAANREQNLRVQATNGQITNQQCEQLIAQNQTQIAARITELANQAMHQAATAGR